MSLRQLQETLLINIQLRYLAAFAYAVLGLPIVMFLAGWLHIYIGIPLVAVFIFGMVWILRRDYWGSAESLRFPIVHLALISVLFVLCVAFSGICGLGVAEFDIPWRMATFRDLVNYDWPVRYESGDALVYYLAFWLPSAFVGKLFGWTGALVALCIHVSIIAITSMLLIAYVLKMNTAPRLWIVALMMIFFSGLCWVGTVIVDCVGDAGYKLLWTGTGYLDFQKSINGEPFNWHYRHNYETLRFIYNQIPFWVVVPLMLSRKTPHSYIYLGLVMLPYSPWCFVGLIPIMIAAAAGNIRKMFKEHGLASVVKDILSPANIAGIVAIVPVFLLFFMSSGQISESSSEITGIGQESDSSAPVGILHLSNFNEISWIGLAIFYVLEFGIYMYLIRKDHLKDPVYWTIIGWLLICPWIWVGGSQSRDWVMNASLPEVFMMMIMVIAYLRDHVAGKALKLNGLCLILAIFFGGLSPFLWTALSIHQMIDAQSIVVENDPIYTYEGKPNWAYSNFLCADPDEELFFQYLAR